MFDIENATVDNELEPERKLWGSVIAQAIMDYNINPLSYRPPIPAKFENRKAYARSLKNYQAKQIDLRRIKDKAGFWLFRSKETGIGSLLWICDNFKISVDCVRKESRKVGGQ